MYIVLYMCLSLFNFSREDLLHMDYFIVFVQNLFHFFLKLTALLFFLQHTVYTKWIHQPQSILSSEDLQTRVYRNNLMGLSLDFHRSRIGLSIVLSG